MFILHFLALAAKSVDDGIPALQGKTVIFRDMARDFSHKAAVQMNHRAALDALEVEVFITLVFSLHILIGRLVALLSSVFDQVAVLL